MRAALDFQSAGGYPNRIRTGLLAGVFYGSYAGRNCVTGALLLDSLGRYRRSNQAVDMGATLAARRALSGGTCNDSLNAIIGDPNPNWMGSFLNEFTILRKVRVRALLDGVFGNDIMNLSTRAQNAGSWISLKYGFLVSLCVALSATKYVSNVAMRSLPKHGDTGPVHR